MTYDQVFLAAAFVVFPVLKEEVSEFRIPYLRLVLNMVKPPSPQ